jgi:hypothetical protein
VVGTLIINGTFLFIGIALVLQIFGPLSSSIVDGASIVLVWLPADVFIHLLQTLSTYDWLTVGNPWLK